MEWSKYFQNPTFMEMTRKAILSEDLRPLIMKYCRVAPGMDVLDIGCGTGCFTRYLAEGMPHLNITGIDTDAVFIEQARITAQEQGMSERVEFMVEDACDLPFMDHCFDAVVSHTFFTSVHKPKKALLEMIRVAKTGATIASITTMSFINEVWHKGYYPDECTWYERLIEVEVKVWKMYQAIDPISNYTKGIPTSEIPHFLAANGLKNVSIYPLGKAFSLSNAAMPITEKQAYIMGMYEAEREKLLNFMELEEIWTYLSRDDCEEYLQLLLAKRNFLLGNVGENRIWEWYGGANVLVTGEL